MNRLIEELSAKKRHTNLSYRKLGKAIGMSGVHVGQVMEGRQPLTRNFAVNVGLSGLLPGVDVHGALEMAGLLPCQEVVSREVALFGGECCRNCGYNYETCTCIGGFVDEYRVSEQGWEK